MEFNQLTFNKNGDDFVYQNLFFQNNYAITIEKRNVNNENIYNIYVMKKRDDSDNTFEVIEINAENSNLYSIITHNNYVTTSEQEIVDIINNVKNLN